MNQCLRAVENMVNMPIPQPIISPLKRRSVGDAGDHAAKRQVVGSPGELSPYPMIRPASAQPLGQGRPVDIKPRSNGLPPLNLTPNATMNPISQNFVLPPRRRGRPRKAETLAHQGAPQMAHYPPISPAPIAPSPVQAIAPRPQSPAAAYQVWSATSEDSKSKKKGRQTLGGKPPLQSETVPRTVQGGSAPETDSRQMAVPSAEYGDWRERSSGREPAQRPTAPAPRELPRELQLPPISPSLPPPSRSP